jgi:hypothetical protein
VKQLADFASAMLAAFKKRNQRQLRKLNDEMLLLAAMDFDPLHFNLAIFSYVLSKIVSKPRFLRPECSGCLTAIERSLGTLVARIHGGKDEDILPSFPEIEKAIGCLEEQDPRFVVDLVTKGKLKMAATLYAQGMSLGIASEMTAMDKQEILDYAGETMMFDRLKDEKTIGERMKFARKLIAE